MGNKRNLLSVFNALDGIELDTLRNRKIFQKQLYFLEKFGLDLGYNFSFYMYGPYSPSATHDAFDLIEQNRLAPDTIETPVLNPEDLSIIERLQTFLDEIPEVRKAHLLELLSSIHFVVHLPYNEGEERDEIEQRLHRMKPNFEFTSEDLDLAWELLEKYSLMT